MNVNGTGCCRNQSQKRWSRPARENERALPSFIETDMGRLFKKLRSKKARTGRWKSSRQCRQRVRLKRRGMRFQCTGIPFPAVGSRCDTAIPRCPSSGRRHSGVHNALCAVQLPARKGNADDADSADEHGFDRSRERCRLAHERPGAAARPQPKTERAQGSQPLMNADRRSCRKLSSAHISVHQRLTSLGCLR